jgi:hypothetical protein
MKKSHNYILDSEYKEPNRPYSQQELKEMIKNLKKKLKLSDFKLTYTQNNYVYYAKKYGKKEKQCLENKQNNIEFPYTNISGCSVEWQLRQTPDEYEHIAKDIVESYMDFELNTPKKITYFNIEIFRMFYTWLYL